MKKSNDLHNYILITAFFVIWFGLWNHASGTLNYFIRNFKFNYQAAAVPALVGGAAYMLRKKESDIKIYKN